MEMIPIVAILSIFIVAPSIVFTFIYMTKRGRLRLEELRIKKEMLELEIEREQTRIALLEAENAKYDRLIEDRGRG
jgi:hypothetical protein